ncbi:serine hydrolase [Candidatus Palauibacter sp.]|uniref:serine hydrolase n=1 Tax=Candidatus Palauibacter sp. TaxID=3101350 RepID=UPI003B02B439
MITRYIFGLVTGGDRSARSRFGTPPGGRIRLQRGLLAAVLAAAAACAPDAGAPGSPGPGAAVEPRADYAEVAAALTSMIEREREQKGLEAFSIALVDGDEVVWADGFGAQDPERGVPASAETVYRVGSVSKLFTDIAVMQLVERGELDLDAPVRQYLPDFSPENPSGTEITLRQLMSHRSGLIREPPTGHYFDDTGTDLAATVASLNGTPQIYPPMERTKYSNAGIAVVGYTLEVTRGEPFADYVRRAVLEPLAMTSSAFTPEPEIVDDLARAYMWGFDRGLFDAPTFELGMAPAGSMYSTVLDLSRFMSALFRGGEGENGRILQPETLESMWAPQFAAEGATSGYGLGFAVEERAGQRRLGHGGAIYGFSTQLAFLPESGIGVVAGSAVDGTNTVTGRVADAALELMLAAKAGVPLPEAPLLGTDPIDPALALELEGVYGEGDDGVELDARGGRLALTPLRGGATLDIRTRGDTLIVDDRLAFGARYLRDGDDLLAIGDAPTTAPGTTPGDEPRRLARRTETGPPPEVPARWAGLIGEYGWDHNVLYILEREGRLHTLIEWFFLYPLEEVSRDVFAFPDRGLYHGERLVFTRDAEGRATAVEAASVRFDRRELGTEAGGTFRIDPVRPVEDLRAEALAASPPSETGSFRESELVEVTSLEPGIRLDVRYATTNNFMSSVFYDEPRVFLQRPAAEALARAHRALAEHGYGLLLHDGYRPWYVTKMFWDATPETDKIFVADPASGSRHNRGSAIDLNLFDLATGDPVNMVGTYDEFSPRSFPNYPGGTSRQRWLRELLRRTMEAEGFTVYEAEWWHFDHEDWRSYAIQNAPFDELGR